MVSENDMNREYIKLFLMINMILSSLFCVVNGSSLLKIVGIPLDGENLFILLIFSLVIHLFVLMILYPVSVILNRLSVQAFGERRGMGGVNVVVIILQALYSIFLYFDLKLYRILGVHLHNDFILKVVENKTFQNDAAMQRTDYIAGGVVIFAVFSGQFILFYLLKRYLKPIKYSRIIITICLGGGIFALGKYSLDHPVADTIPFYELIRNYNTNTRVTINYPEIEQGMKIKHGKNILFIMIETLRGDHLNQKFMPGMIRFQQQNRCMISSSHLPGSHSTVASLFSLIYGLNSYHYLPFLRKYKIPAAPLQLLKQNHYNLAAVMPVAIEKFDDSRYLTEQFTHYQSVLEQESKTDPEIIEKIKEIYLKRDKNKPLFLLGFLYSPHFGYYYSEPFKKYTPVIDLNDRHFAISANDMGVDYREKLFNRYRNSLLYVDEMVTQLLQIFQKEINSGELIVVITGDHGEEFWEHGGFGHVQAKFTRERINVPLIFCLPGIEQNLKGRITSHTDIWPTIFDYMGINFKGNQFFDGLSLLQKRERGYGVVSSFYYPSPKNPVALIGKREKVVIQQKSKTFKKGGNFRVKGVYRLDDQPLREITPELRSAIEQFQKQYQRFLKFH